MFDAIRDFSLESVSSLLAFFYSLPVVGGSFGVAIMLLTATVMIVLMPLTVKATRSTIKMTQLQPEMRRLQKEHKEDRQKLNQEMMALYQEHGVNPVGGCLPMLAQLPVFLVLFNVLRGLTRRVSETPYFAVGEHARELNGGAVIATDTFAPNYLSTDTELYQDLSGQTEMNFGPFDLALNAWDVVQDNFLSSLVYIVLIAFVVGTSYYQQRQVSARRGSQPDNPTPQQQTQQQLLRILPLMTGIWSFFFPAGLVLYWATSNVFRIGQQSYITRALYSEDGPGAQLAELQAKQAAQDKADAEAEKEAEKKAKAEKAAKRAERKKASAGNGSGSNGSGSGSGRNGSGSNGSDGSDGSDRLSRDEAWARRRAQKTKAAQGRKKTASEGSSRTTPKGTKPTAAKKKRKR